MVRKDVDFSLSLGFLLHVHFSSSYSTLLISVTLDLPQDAETMAILDFSTSSHMAQDPIPIINPLFHVTHGAQAPEVSKLRRSFLHLAVQLLREPVRSE